MAEFQPSPLSYGDDYGFIFVTLAALSAAKAASEDGEGTPALDIVKKYWWVILPLAYIGVTKVRDARKEEQA